MKDFDALYAGTGLDRREKVRRRVLHRAKRAAKRKTKDKTSSGSGSSSSKETSDIGEEVEDTLFEGETKIQRVAQRAPGALAWQALTTMRANLLQEAGAEQVSGSLGPVAMLYMRQRLQKRATGPAARELLTLAMAVDLMLRSRPSKALDVLLQRMKAVEAGLMGSHWSVTQRLEIGPGDLLSMTGQEELVSAQRAAHTEARTRMLASYPEGREVGRQEQRQRAREGQRKRRQGERQTTPQGGSAEQVTTPGDGRTLRSSITGCIAAAGDGAPEWVGDLVGALGTGAVGLDGSMQAVVDQPTTMSPSLGDKALRQFPPMPPPFVSEAGKVKAPDTDVRSAQKVSEGTNLVGRPFSELGGLLVRWFMEVSPLRSKTTGKGTSKSVFPMPTSIEFFRTLWPSGCEESWQWMRCVCVGLNSFWGGPLCNDFEASDLQEKVLRGLFNEVERFCELGLKSVGVDWTTFFAVRGIDYKGDEVKVAKWVTWANIGPALPKEIGAGPLEEVCSLGCREYVESFDRFLKPCHLWGEVSRPKVMVEDSAWGEMRTGLVESGVCCYLEECEVFHVGSTPLLNGLFGVSKEEWTPENIEVCRLIMNLVPLNELCEPLGGDVDTLPSWGTMNPYFLQPDENLLISSEDVKRFFYTMRVPRCWTKFLAFNKAVPDHVLPPDLQGHTVYLASRVLPMGFLNSVSIAQHVHRNLVRWSTVDGRAAHVDEAELRKDRSFTVANPSWRVYLDNYDVLEKVVATGMVEVEGTVPEGILALRQEYMSVGRSRGT